MIFVLKLLIICIVVYQFTLYKVFYIQLLVIKIIFLYNE